MSGLTDIGAGAGSKNEAIKAKSEFLRGDIAKDLAGAGSGVSAESEQLLKFHGIYQQENRDERAQRKATGQERQHSFMSRTRIPGGVITGAQYLAHDDIAERYGNGTLRLTTRQAIQLHGVLKPGLRSAINAINSALLSTIAACGDVNRNVLACPAPVHSRAHSKVQEIATKISMHLAPQTKAYSQLWVDGESVELDAIVTGEEEPIYGRTYLPRKFKIAVAHPGDNCVDIYTNDIGVVAALAGAEVEGYTLVIGGGLGMTHNKPNTYPRLATPLAFVTESELLEVIEAIVTVQRDFGDRSDRRHARMKYLVEEKGIAAFRSEIETRIGRKLAPPREIHFDVVDDHLGWQPQPNGRFALGLFIPSGRVADTGGKRVRSALRLAIAQFGLNARITAQQNIILTDIAARDRSALSLVLKDHGIETDAAALGFRRYSMACPAMPTCGLAVAESERAIPTVLDALDIVLRELELHNERISVRMTGCPNGCARPYMGDIGLVGRSLGLYDVFVGGDFENTRLNRLYRSSVRFAEIVPLLKPLLVRWKAERQGREGFGDFVHRVEFSQAAPAGVAAAS